MDIKKLEEKLKRTKSASEKAEILGLIDRLKKEESKEETTEKSMTPVRDATPIADHKDSRVRSRGDVMVTDQMVLM
ncbi:MAG: hypothetical protein IKR19_07525 [Acholeplasmatales bacterium]|nr:hypothetical protein [Acholeplasmatales bacterium]